MEDTMKKFRDSSVVQFVSAVLIAALLVTGCVALVNSTPVPTATPVPEPTVQATIATEPFNVVVVQGADLYLTSRFSFETWMTDPGRRITYNVTFGIPTLREYSQDWKQRVYKDLLVQVLVKSDEDFTLLNPRCSLTTSSYAFPTEAYAESCEWVIVDGVVLLHTGRTKIDLMANPWPTETDPWVWKAVKEGWFAADKIDFNRPHQLPPDQPVVK